MPKRRSASEIRHPTRDRALHLLAGTWRTDGQLIGVPAGPEATLIAVDRYEWLPGLNLLAHHVAGHLGAVSVASFEVWTYDRRQRTHTSTAFDQDGALTQFKGRLRGRRWDILGETQRFRGAFSPDGLTLSGKWDQRSRNVWKPWLAITLRKLG